MAHQHPEPRTRGRDRKHTDELETFLERFAEAVAAGDGEAAANLWQVPAYVIGTGMARALSGRAEIVAFYASAREQYNANSITDTTPQILDEDWIDDNLVVARVRWPYLDDSGREIGAEASDYTISRDDKGQLRLRVAVMRGVEGSKTGEPS